MSKRNGFHGNKRKEPSDASISFSVAAKASLLIMLGFTVFYVISEQERVPTQIAEETPAAPLEFSTQ